MGVAEFWRWWAGARDEFAASIQAGRPPSADEISERVAALDPQLEWELAPGRRSRHALVVSTAGRAELRRTVAEWLAGAPPADATWEYHASRQPDPRVTTMHLELDGHRLSLADLRFGATLDEQHACVDVVVHHPEFSTMEEGATLRVAFMTLDWVLGEDRVEEWLGTIDATTEPSSSYVDHNALVAMIDALTVKYHEPTWVMLSGTRHDVPVLAMAQRPLRGIRWPRFDTHVAVNLPYEDRGNGFPTDESLTRIRAAEDYLADVVGSHGELLAHETSAGVRTLHFYVDGSTDAAARLTAGVRTFGGTTESDYDPGVENVKHLA